jgi:hypothetical protein
MGLPVSKIATVNRDFVIMTKLVCPMMGGVLRQRIRISMARSQATANTRLALEAAIVTRRSPVHCSVPAWDYRILKTDAVTLAMKKISPEYSNVSTQIVLVMSLVVMGWRLATLLQLVPTNCPILRMRAPLLHQAKTEVMMFAGPRRMQPDARRHKRVMA